jgi:excisionase family DNA binding protein
MFTAMKFLTVHEVAEIIRESEENVRRRCASGQIRAKKLGSSWRIEEEDVRVFMNVPTTPSPRKRLTKRQRGQLGL